MSKIIKGRNLMLFDENGKSFAFATKHQLSISVDTEEVSSRESGIVNDLIMTKYSWEITSENLFTTKDYKNLFNLMLNGTKITVRFGLKEDTSKTVADNEIDTWTLDVTNFYEGQVLITSLSVNSNNGENATYSVTFSGSGQLVNKIEYKDITNDVMGDAVPYIYDEDTKQLENWTMTLKNAKIPTDRIITTSDYIILIGGAADWSFWVPFTAPYDGNYRLTINTYCCYNNNGSVLSPNTYGTIKINDTDYYKSSGEYSYVKGSSSTRKTANDITYSYDGKTWYGPNKDNYESVMAYIDNFKHTVDLGYLNKGTEIKLTLGKIKGDTYTHVCFGNPKIEYIN